MKHTYNRLVPTSIELFAGLFASIVIILLANSKQLLTYYGLQSSDQLIKASANNSLSDALKTVDSFSATNGVVTFLIWAVVGIICFGIVEGLGSAYQQLRLEKQVSSARYVHPAAFTRVSFWRGVVLNSITLMLGLVLLLITTLGLLLFLVPLGLAYSRVFLFNISLGNVINILLGVVLVLAGLVLLNVVIRLLLHRRQIFAVR